MHLALLKERDRPSAGYAGVPSGELQAFVPHLGRRDRARFEQCAKDYAEQKAASTTRDSAYGSVQLAPLDASRIKLLDTMLRISARRN